MVHQRVLHLSEFGPMHWYWVAKGLAKQLTAEVQAYQEVKGKIKDDWVDDVKGFCFQIADTLLVALDEHDRVVRRLDPCTDVEPLRYDPDIMAALGLMEEI